MKIILASKSPRRRQLVEALGYEVRCVDVEVNETIRGDVGIEEVAETLALRKSEAYRQTIGDDEVLLTADTVVVVGGKVVGKPKNEEEAYEMLENLSGHEHVVYTGVCLRSSTKRVSFTEKTDVHFRKLTHEEICSSIKTDNPFDKAGAYGIQERIGMIGIDRIDGDYYNVMGLPVCRTYCEILKLL